MNVRNFVIIAHIDHGKSTLADRLLEITESVETRAMREQYLDRMDLEREKGITIKMQPVRMLYKHPEITNPNNQNNVEYVLNLIDTPGHADFSYEVSRSLFAVEGAILLVDATKGIQAQTLANLKVAREQKLVIVPAVNKIDSPLARTDEVAGELADLLGVSHEEVFRISAKTGQGVKRLLEAVVANIPPPERKTELPFRGLIFDSSFDSFRGVIAYVRVMEGTAERDQKFRLSGTNAKGSVKEVGYFLPQEKSVVCLEAGEIGYIATGIKEANAVRVGDTIASDRPDIKPIPGFRIPRSVVFTSLYPQDPDAFDSLKYGMERLRLSDPSVSFEVESKEALGRGFRCGFLGILHSEIVAERIRREFGIDLVISRPSVEFRVSTKKGTELSVKTPADWPSPQEILKIEEPWARLEVIVPLAFFSPVIQILEELEGFQAEMRNMGEHAVVLAYEVPLREIITDLYERLKSATQGMASMDYEMKDWKTGDLVKMDILIAREPEEALAMIVPRASAVLEGRKVLEKLKNALPSQQFEVVLQAAIGGRVIARETIRARRKDVTGALYGGDVTRKRKLLDKQKKGKKDLLARGKIRIPAKVFFDVFRTS